MESDRLCTLYKKQEGSLEHMVNSCETVKTCKIGAQNKVYTYNEIFSQIVDRKLIELVTKIERMINDTKEKENNRVNDDEWKVCERRYEYKDKLSNEKKKKKKKWKISFV